MKRNFMLKDLFENRLHFSVKVKNLTSGTKPVSEVTMIEVMDDGSRLEVPARICTVSHKVLIIITVETESGAKKRVTRDIEAIGKVTHIENLEDGKSEITVTFNQFVREEWLFLINFLETQQKFIKQLTESLKKLG